jgi:hypothetical protein
MPSKKLTTVAAEPTRMDDGAIQVEVTLPVRPRRQESRKGGQSDPFPDAESRSRIPRITRLMALAIKFQEMVNPGEVLDYADLARLGYVTRARVTQIMNLALLAPDLQEELLFATEAAGATERAFRQIITFVDWDEQRKRWKQVQAPATQKSMMSTDSGTRRATKIP